MYSLSDYGSMIADRVRMDAYAIALKRVINKDSVVLDIGAAAGIHALLAAKFGAKKVFAIEPNDVVHLARQLAVENGLAHKIEFIQDLSQNVILPEQANIIVSDLRGILPLFSRHIPTIVDARQRHLAPDGKMIPKRDTLYIAPVEYPQKYKQLTQPWDYPYGLNMNPVVKQVLNSWGSDNTEDFTTKHLLAEPQVWSVLDYSLIESPDVIGSDFHGRASRDGVFHGFFVWFNAELIDDVGFSNGPTKFKTTEVYGRGFFPLLEPVRIESGDTISINLNAKLAVDEYIWNWDTKIFYGQGQNNPKISFSQSTNHLHEPDNLAHDRHILDLRPILGKSGEIDKFILQKMDGNTAIKSIAQDLMICFPKQFSSLRASIQYIYEIFIYYAV